MLKQKLVALGAPLRGVKPSAVAASELIPVLLDATELARRDAVVARSLPLCLWKHRARINAKALSELSASAEAKHAFAFLLELAGELGNDRRLVGLAEALRDHRLTQCRPFFHAGPADAESDFPLAKKWGFSIQMDLDSFRGLFDKFADHA
jgi:hypothetical protein